MKLGFVTGLFSKIPSMHKALNFGKEEEEGGLSDSGDSLSAVHPAIRVDLTPSPLRCLWFVC